MPITWGELPRQQVEIDFSRPTARRDYWVDGTRDKTQALLAVAQASPAYESSIDAEGQPILLFRSKVSCNERGGGGWESTVYYDGSTDSIELNVTQGVRSTKIFQALDTVAIYDLVNGGAVLGSGLGTADFQDVPAFHNLIGDTGDEVQGMEAEEGVFEFTLTKKWKRAVLPSSYYSTMRDMMRPRTGVNHATFVIIWKGQTLTFPKGSLRIRNFGARQKSDDELSIDYAFHYDGGIVEADNFTIDGSNPITKEGHQKLEIKYRKDVNNNAVITRPYAATVLQIYPYKNFAQLEL